MKVIYSNENFIVIDDFLSKDDFAHMWNFIQEERFRYVHSEKWIKAFRLSDGNPMWGDVYISEKIDYDNESSVFPMKRGIDPLFEQMNDALKTFKPYIGNKGKEWNYYFARPYLYPRDAGLSWHTDGRGDMSGAFVYYCHPEWNALWGSELLIHSSEAGKVKYPQTKMYDGKTKILGLHMDHTAASEHLMKEGMGQYILPKPNRMVVLKPGLIHRINRVDPAAGDHIRASITGFFLRKSNT